MELYKFCVILIFMATSLFIFLSNGEFYTATSDLEKLLKTEEEVTKILEHYVEEEEKRVSKIKWLTEQFARFYKEANENEENFVMNPVNAYLLMKRLTTDWETVNNFIYNNDSKAVVKSMNPEIMFPSIEDLSGAATALIRLQKMYFLDTKALADGEVKGAEKSTQLTAGDCFELGRQAYTANLYNHSIQWLTESLNRIDKEDIPSIKKSAIFENLAYASAGQQNYTAAVSYAKQAISLDPEEPKYSHALEVYQIYSAAHVGDTTTEDKTEEAPPDVPEIEVPLEEWPDDLLHPSVFPAYEKLCRGESLKTPMEESKLDCYYTTNNNSYLLLQPLKVEVLNLSPRIVMYYDVLKDNEANLIKEISTPMLRRATVNNEKEGGTEPASYRISKSTWLDDFLHPAIPHLNRRIEDIAGLHTSTAEALHVINYGIGGHYEPHYDYVRGKALFQAYEGNRIATWIFYLSDVPAGGSTVFPFIGVNVKPVKGAAAFWHNLYRNGRGDIRTMHAACPVLTGSKWVANKWIHEIGNEFRRPCSLNKSE